MKTIFSILILMVVTLSARTQILVGLSYDYLPVVNNSAACALDNKTRISASAYINTLCMNDKIMPSETYLAYEQPINKHHALGTTLYNQQYGFEQISRLKIQYRYAIQFEKSRLLLGGSVILNRKQLDADWVTIEESSIWHEDDPLVYENQTKYRPGLDLGIWFQTKYFDIAFAYDNGFVFSSSGQSSYNILSGQPSSINAVLGAHLFQDNIVSVRPQLAYYNVSNYDYVIGGVNFEINNSFKFGLYTFDDISLTSNLAYTYKNLQLAFGVGIPYDKTMIEHSLTYTAMISYQLN